MGLFTYVLCMYVHCIDVLISLLLSTFYEVHFVVTMYNNLIIHGITTYCYYRQIIVMLIDIQPHLIFVLYLYSVTSQSLSLSRDSQRVGLYPSSILTSRAASRHKNLHVKSPGQSDRVTRLMCVGRKLE